MRWLCIAAIVAGIFFRLYHADRKLYSPEEIATSLFVSGHTNHDVDVVLAPDRVHHMDEMRRLLVPGADASAYATWHALWLEHPQHPPLYFELAILPDRLAGDSIYLRRLPAIVFGLAAIAAAGWFGRRLTHDADAGRLTAALVAVSPFHVAYAQENREYSLYTLLVCTASALLISVLEDRKPLRLAAYALAVGVGLWTFTLFALVVVAHAIVLALPWRTFEPRKRLIAGAALAIGAATFAPWAYVLATRSGIAANDMGWEAAGLPASLYFGKWLFNVGSMFFDLDYISLAFLPIVLAAIAFAAYAVVAYLRDAPPRRWCLAAVLAGVTLLVMLVPDVVRHEERGLQSRYLTTLWIGIEVLMAAGIAAAFRTARGMRLRAWQSAFAAIVVAGIVSDAVGAQARTWWNTGSARNRDIPAMIDRLNALPSPTIVYHDFPSELPMFEQGAGGHSDVAYFLHATLDAAALASAAHPYAVLSPGEARAQPAHARLVKIPLALGFEMQPEPAITALRRRGTAARGTAGQLDLDPALYGAR